MTVSTADIRFRLALLVMASVVPAALMALVLISHIYGRERERFVLDSMATARAMTQAIDRELASVRIAAEVLSTSPYLQRGDLSGFYAQAKSVVRQQVGQNVVLSGATGQQLVNTLTAPGEPLPRHGNPAQLRRVFETGRPVASDVYIGQVLQRPLMSIDVPVFRDGKVVYDLSIGIQLDRFAKLLSDQRLPPNRIAVVFDSTGTIAARTQEMERAVGTKGTPELLKRMQQVAEDSLETTLIDGARVVAVFSRSAETHWTVALGIPARELNGVLGQSPWWFVVGVVVLTLASFGVAWAIGARFSRSRPSLAKSKRR
jgi:hypothetical protein